MPGDFGLGAYPKGQRPPQGAIQKSTPCGEIKAVPSIEIPPNPPLQKGGSNSNDFTSYELSSPFGKGGSRGISRYLPFYQPNKG